MKAFKKSGIAHPFIDHPEVIVHFVGGFSKILNPTVSLVCFSVKGRRLMIASKHFKQNNQSDAIKALYQSESIGKNIDLTTLPHGDDHDTFAINMPLFEQAADQIHAFYSTHPKDTLLINCGHGRSRSGTATAFYLMKHLGYSAEEAIDIVSAVLNHRGIGNSISIQTRCTEGNYGDWLKRWEKDQKLENTTPNDETQSPEQTDGFFRRIKRSRIEKPKEHNADPIPPPRL